MSEAKVFPVVWPDGTPVCLPDGTPMTAEVLVDENGEPVKLGKPVETRHEWEHGSMLIKRWDPLS